MLLLLPGVCWYFPGKAAEEEDDDPNKDRLIQLDEGHFPHSDMVPSTQTWSGAQPGEQVATQLDGVQLLGFVVVFPASSNMYINPLNYSFSL